MNKEQLKRAIEIMAREQGKSELDIISEAQAGAALQDNEISLDMLCDLKWDYID